MIIQLLLRIVITFVNILFSWLPTVESLPLGIDGVLTTASSYFHGAIETVPYLQVVWTCFLYALAFELLLKLLKVFLGHRLPVANEP